ncbi:MAG TPA: serine/threonine-protein kinase, partial [Thermodesulfobacteriota bacterium]|nr:serine/threonine-protein kinase [Thermodesulfobacteriota bacterium]
IAFFELGLVLAGGVALAAFLPRISFPSQIIVSATCLLLLGGLAVGSISRGVWLKPFFPGVAVILQFALAWVQRSPATQRREGGAEGKPPVSTPAMRVEPVEEQGARKTIGRYQISGELGHGAMGVVYRGRDPLIDRPVAIKTIRFDRLSGEGEIQNLKERFFTEARAAGGLSHPEIVTIFDVGEDRGLSYIAMEYVAGEMLSGYTAPERLLPPARVLEIIAGVAEALDFAHRHGIVHRDVKPANIMITPEGHIKVMDFGIAKVASSTQTQAGSVLGTPSYMSPEQIRGEDLDGRSDLFSLGSVLYELLTGRRPFRAANLAALSDEINKESPLPASQVNPGIPDTVDPVLGKAMAKDREERYATGMEMAQALRSVLKTLASSSS